MRVLLCWSLAPVEVPEEGAAAQQPGPSSEPAFAPAGGMPEGGIEVPLTPGGPLTVSPEEAAAAAAAEAAAAAAAAAAAVAEPESFLRSTTSAVPFVPRMPGTPIDHLPTAEEQLRVCRQRWQIQQQQQEHQQQLQQQQQQRRRWERQHQRQQQWQHQQ